MGNCDQRLRGAGDGGSCTNDRLCTASGGRPAAGDDSLQSAAEALCTGRSALRLATLRCRCFCFGLCGELTKIRAELLVADLTLQCTLQCGGARGGNPRRSGRRRRGPGAGGGRSGGGLQQSAVTAAAVASDNQHAYSHTSHTARCRMCRRIWQVCGCVCAAVWPTDNSVVAVLLVLQPAAKKCL